MVVCSSVILVILPAHLARSIYLRNVAFSAITRSLQPRILLPNSSAYKSVSLLVRSKIQKHHRTG
jgi:hypothetical protein